MKKWKIGLVVLGLISAIGCGDSSSGDGDGTGDNTNGNGNTDTTSGANAPATNGTDDDAGSTGTPGGNSAGQTDGGQTAGSNAGGSDAGSSTGTPGTGACTNAADKAIVDAAKVEKLACEGAACAGKNLSNAAGQTKCIADEAPTLKQLSAGCQKCFDEITSCVPSKCVALLGGEDACGISLPNTDFSKCSNPPATDAKCLACNVKNCQPAFKTCSGLSD